MFYVDKLLIWIKIYHACKLFQSTILFLKLNYKDIQMGEIYMYIKALLKHLYKPFKCQEVVTNQF